LRVLPMWFSNTYPWQQNYLPAYHSHLSARNVHPSHPLSFHSSSSFKSNFILQQFQEHLEANSAIRISYISSCTSSPVPQREKYRKEGTTYNFTFCGVHHYYLEYLI
jgi:hypothetical protein